jgi:hypothetical protein
MSMVLNQDIDTQAIANSIVGAYQTFIEGEERKSSFKAQNIFAGGWSPCLRFGVLQMTRGDEFPAFPSHTLANFRRGKDRERDLKADITRVGRLSVPMFELTGMEERFAVKDRKGREVITGKVDGRLNFPDVYIDVASRRRLVAPIEFKAWNSNMVAGVKTFDDLLDNKWMKKGARQLLIYLLATEQPIGFMALDRAGLPLILPVELSRYLGLAEEFMQYAEKAKDHVEAGTLPEYFKEASECKTCRAFGTVCSPPISYDAAKIIVDEETLMLIETHEANYEAAKTYEKAHKKLAEQFKVMTPKSARSKAPTKIIAGRFVVDGSWSKQTGWDFPTPEVEADLKQKYQASVPDGKFGFEITEVDK